MTTPESTDLVLAAAGQLIFSSPRAHELSNWILPAVIPIGLLCGIIFYMLRSPLLRREQAGLLLDLIESAIEQGQSIERCAISLSGTRDKSVGARFHLLAALMEQGYGLVRALEKLPRFLPPQLPAMLKTGEALGDFSRVLPACRNVLHDGISQSRALINYQLTFALFANPLVLLMLFAIPPASATFGDILRSLGIPAPQLFGHFDRLLPVLIWMQLALVIILYVCAIFLLGGARFVSWIEVGIAPLGKAMDWLAMRVPWHRKRLTRDFSAILALLLDGGVPEEEAVRLAGSSTANKHFIRRSEAVRRALRGGVKLTEAIRGMDDTGEFRWRLANAAQGDRRFFSALKGWHEWLDAAAFKEEQAAAQTISTALILLNAATVGLVAVGVFQVISQLSVTIYSAHPR